MVLIRQEEALKKFHITDNPDNYYLARAVDEGQIQDTLDNNFYYCTVCGASLIRLNLF